MRFSKTALLLFGAGLLLGLIAIAGELRWLERAASFAMAFGIAALPVTIVLDLRRRVSPKLRPAGGKAGARRGSGRPKPRRKPATARR